MAKVLIKTQTGQYVGGGRTAELTDRITRAFVYEDGPEIDSQITIVNTIYGWTWRKVDAEVEYDRMMDEAAP